MKILFIDSVGGFEISSVLAAFCDIDPTYDFEKSARSICKDAKINIVRTQRMCMDMPLVSITTPRNEKNIQYDEIKKISNSLVSDSDILCIIQKMWSILNQGFADAKRIFDLPVDEFENTLCGLVCVAEWIKNQQIQYIVMLPPTPQNSVSDYSDKIPSAISENIFFKNQIDPCPTILPADAAAMCALANEFGPMPEMDILKSGYGARYDENFTRAVIGVQGGDFYLDIAAETFFEMSYTS